MKTLIALFRGINVGGKNILPMKELASVLGDLGLTNIKTYIQSGNVVFQSKSVVRKNLSRAISSAIEKSHGFRPELIILSVAQLQKAVASNPFPEGEIEPKSLHLFFLASRSENPDLNRLDTSRANGERFQLVDRVFYLHTPEGIGKSRLAAKVEIALGVPVTARNWRSVGRILSLAEGGH